MNDPTTHGNQARDERDVPCNLDEAKQIIESLEYRLLNAQQDFCNTSDVLEMVKGQRNAALAEAERLKAALQRLEHWHLGVNNKDTGYKECNLCAGSNVIEGTLELTGPVKHVKGCVFTILNDKEPTQ